MVLGSQTNYLSLWTLEIGDSSLYDLLTFKKQSNKSLKNNQSQVDFELTLNCIVSWKSESIMEKLMCDRHYKDKIEKTIICFLLNMINN